MAIAALGLSASAALACEGQTGMVIFEDKFADDAGGWRFGSGLALQAPGAVLTLPPAGKASRVWLNQTFNATEGDFCAEMSMPADAKDVNFGTGLVFLAVDNQNYWLAGAEGSGTAFLARVVNNKSNIIWTVPDAAIKTDASAVNSVRAVVKNGAITVIVNGHTIKTVRAQIPSGDHLFGFLIQYTNGSATPVEASLRSYKVTEAK